MPESDPELAVLWLAELGATVPEWRQGRAAPPHETRFGLDLMPGERSRRNGRRLTAESTRSEPDADASRSPIPPAPLDMGRPGGDVASVAGPGALSAQPEVRHMMPSPRDDAPRGDPIGRPETRHLTCACQRDADEPLSLCGLRTFPRDPSTDRDVDPGAPPPGRRVWCVVCYDMARAALDVGHCQRCPT